MKFIVTVGFLFALDTLTKWGAKFFLPENTISLWENIISLELHFNEGIAFSLPLPRFAQIFISLLFLVGFFFWAKKYFFSLSKLEQWGSSILLSGAIGNMWERILFGQVTDFISIWIFPVFNIADICISVGVLLWFLGSVMSDNKKGK